jgi:hypothetical protein
MWQKEMREALESRDVDTFIKFIEKWSKQGMYDKSVVKDIKSKKEWVAKGYMCKMIMNIKGISLETTNWAEEYLDRIGWSYDIF